jgi:hypothetical protein
MAEEIEVPFTGTLSGFGTLSGEFYRGQTFIGPGGLATELTVYVGPSPDVFRNVDFRILLTEVKTSNGFHPTNVLFESEKLTVTSFRETQVFTVNLGSIPLESGETYAWILDAFADWEGDLWSSNVGIDLSAGFADGLAVRLVTGPFPPPGDREDHFALSWFVDVFHDFAFRLVYMPVMAEAVAVDIRPQSCPNPLRIPNNGVLPVAIMGTPDLDVGMLDIASIRLEGVAPRRSAFEDVAAPFEPFSGKEDAFDCNEDGPDGYEDLVLKFEADAVIDTLAEGVADGDVINLQLTGTLLPEFGGGDIVGEDVVIIRRHENNQ